MTTYADSSFLVSLHREDANYKAANDYMAKAACALTFTALHRIEVRNAMRNARACGAMTASECRLAFRQIDEDLRDGLLVHFSIDWADVFRRADQLSEKFSDTAGQRTIDLLHVAIALESGAKTFLSFDARQRALAVAVGLKVKP